MIKKNLMLRSKILQIIRKFFFENDYIEVETPNRIKNPAPEANIDAEVCGDHFLHTSPELCMKQLMAQGFEKIFQICKVFRQKERGNLHLPEFTLLEWYSAGIDYFDMMKECEYLIQSIAENIGIDNTIEYQNNYLDFSSPWDKLTVSKAFETYASMSCNDAFLKDKFDEIMAFEIEPHLGKNKPLFLYDYPKEKASLAKLKTNSLFAERFELYIGGLEICNAFTELTDPKEQRKRFEEELLQRKISGKTVYEMPEKFLDSLVNMPYSTGNALGVDRLIMIFANAEKIDDVVSFVPEEV